MLYFFFSDLYTFSFFPVYCTSLGLQYDVECIGSRFPCFALLKNPASMLSVGYLKMLFIRLIKGNFLLYHFCWEFLWICTLLIFCIPSNIWKNSPVKMFRSRAFLVGKFIIKHLFFLTELLKFYIFSHVILVSYIFRGIFHYLKLSNLLV